MDSSLIKLRLKDMRSISDIISTPLEEFNVTFEESYLYPLVKQYQRRVIAFEIIEDADECVIILEGDRKYFMVCFYLDSKDISRIWERDMGESYSEKMLVVDEQAFSKFEKILLLENLQESKEI